MTGRIAAIAVVGLLAFAGIAAGAVIVEYDTGTEFENATLSATNVTYNNDTVNVTESYQTEYVTVDGGASNVTINATNVTGGNTTATVYNSTGDSVATETIDDTNVTTLNVTGHSTLSIELEPESDASIEVDRIAIEADSTTGGTGLTGSAIGDIPNWMATLVVLVVAGVLVAAIAED